jgi:hypothetical protein
MTRIVAVTLVAVAWLLAFVGKTFFFIVLRRVMKSTALGHHNGHAETAFLCKYCSLLG